MDIEQSKQISLNLSESDIANAFIVLNHLEKAKLLVSKNGNAYTNICSAISDVERTLGSMLYNRASIAIKEASNNA